MESVARVVLQWDYVTNNCVDMFSIKNYYKNIPVMESEIAGSLFRGNMSNNHAESFFMKNNSVVLLSYKDFNYEIFKEDLIVKCFNFKTGRKLNGTNKRNS